MTETPKQLFAEPSAAAQRPLPSPVRERWEILRSGMVNLYRYDQQEFHFEQGRLLLRGNNGTGKSRVLALQLPFLLDGEVHPDRIEPDRDQAKRIEWNLLMGRYSDRMGYTWIEFGKRDAEGTERFTTLGCGLSAIEGRGLVDKWFFITPRRIGQDFTLVSAGGIVANRERLAQALGNQGRIFRTARDYRRAVDETFFKLGEARYDALVSLLIQLRQPQLSRTLDEERLSQALGEALPPVSQQVMGDIAEAFRELESDRKVLSDFRAAYDAVIQFLSEYRIYARIAARRRSDGVRNAHNHYEATARKLRTAETLHEKAAEQLKMVADQIRQLGIAEESCQSTVSAFANSPQMKDAQALDRAERSATNLRRDVGIAAEDKERTAAALVGAAEQKELAEREAAAAGESAGTALRHVEKLAAAAGMNDEHTKVFMPINLEDIKYPASVETARKNANDELSRREKNIRHVRKRSEEVKHAEQNLNVAKEFQDEMAGQHTEAVERVSVSESQFSASVAELAEAYGRWHGSLREIHPAAPEEMAAWLAEWQDEPEQVCPLADAVHAAATNAQQEIARERTEAQQRHGTATEELSLLNEEKTRLAAGHHEPPPVPYTRDAAARLNRPGAPLWQVCEFAEKLPADQRAGLEAALESSGLLDAWITPDGLLLDAQDTAILSDANSEKLYAHSLAEVLCPAVDRKDPGAAALSDRTVAGVLERIRLGSPDESARSGACVDLAGHWQLGPLRGYWLKAAPAYVGHAAREEDRRRRLALVEERIAETSRQIDAARAAIEGADARAAAAEAERRAAPTDTACRNAAAKMTQARLAADTLREKLNQSDARVMELRGELNRTIATRNQEAEDLGIRQWVDDLQKLEDDVRNYGRALSEFWPLVSSLLTSRRDATSAARRYESAAEEDRRYDERLQTVEKKAAAAEAEARVLRETVGASVDQVMAELTAARAELAQVQKNKEDAGERRTTLLLEQTTHARDAANLQEQIEAQLAQRQQAIEQLATYVKTATLAVACPDLSVPAPVDWSATTAVDLARDMEARLADVDHSDAAWSRVQKTIYQQVTDLDGSLSSQGYESRREQHGDLLVVTMPYQGRILNMAELPGALGAEVQERQMILDQRERDVLEKYLIGELARHLHDRIHEAEKLVHEMNEELRRRPTSTGMMLRFTWEPRDDGPSGLAEARKKLLSANVTWSPDEQKALGAFLQEQIQNEQKNTEAGTWLEHLTAALDYRRWHRFGIERQQDGQWKKLTRRTHGTGSGGEKAIALTIPQFAAAAAHYQSAAPDSPRLILLDEAFVGVDGDMRAKCLGLLHAFDLDFMMTSEREWCCYPTLPGVAIYQLAVRPGIDAVGVTRWIWNGHERKKDGAD